MSDEATITEEIRALSDDMELVNSLAIDMLFKLRQNCHKAHWNTVSNAYLFERLKEEVAELESALSGDSEDVMLECADVANFAAMIADNSHNVECIYDPANPRASEVARGVGRGSVAP